MKKAIIKESLPLFTRETEVPQIPMEREDYLFRIGLLRARMAEDRFAESLDAEIANSLGGEEDGSQFVDEIVEF